MKNVLIEVKSAYPYQYSINKKELDNILICFERGTNETWGYVIINNISFRDPNKIIEYAFNDLITTSGTILIRCGIFDLHKHAGKSSNKFNEMIRTYIDMDHVEFIAQCVNNEYKRHSPTVKTILICITREKISALINKVRFISMTDRLEPWEYSGMPFTREECLSQKNYSDIKKSDITDLYPYSYLPLNKSEHDQDEIELSEFMEFSPNSFSGEVKHGLDHGKFFDEMSVFEAYTLFIEQKEEEFESKKKPFYSRIIVNNSAIVFLSSHRSELRSLLILDPPYPIFINKPRSNNDETYISIQIKHEWIERVDIEYVYLETRKANFLKQFYYYNGWYSTIGLKSTTILRAKVAKLPPIKVQKEIVRKEKEKFFSERQAKLDSHKRLLSFEEEKLSLEKQLGEIDKKLFELKRDIVNSDPILKGTIESCRVIIPERREEAISLLYEILPVKKCIDENTDCSTSGFGNRARTILECVMHTLQVNNVIPRWYDHGSSVKHICRDKVGWSSMISTGLQNNLQTTNFLANKYSHEGDNLPLDNARVILNTIIQLIAWLEEFLGNNLDLAKNFKRWVERVEQEPIEGTRKRSGMIGVITREWIKKDGKKEGAWITPFIDDEQLGSGKQISISSKIIQENGLGLGSIIKFDAIIVGEDRSKDKWKSINVEVINECPKNYKIQYQDDYIKKNRRRINNSLSNNQKNNIHPGNDEPNEK